MNRTESALLEARDEMQGHDVGYLSVPPLELLRERVAAAVSDVPFYRRLYAPCGPMPPGRGFLEWFERLPVVSKSQLQAAGSPALTNPRYERPRLVEKPTSGSTGIPFVLYLDPTLINFRKWRFQRPYQSLGAAPSRLVYVFPWDFVVRTPREERSLAGTVPSSASTGRIQTNRRVTERQESPGPRFESLPKKSKGEARATRSAATISATSPAADRPYTVNSLLPPEELFANLNQLQPVSLVGFASTLAALARWMSVTGERLPSLRQVWTTSEILAPDGADAIRNAMDCVPLTIYASNEFGFMAWESEADGAMLFEADRLHVEFLRTQGTARAEPGEFARLVVTDLLNDTMPLIRYDIGDIARVGEPMRVTPELVSPTMVDLQGKEPDLLEAADGRWATTFEILGTIKDNLPHAQYRFVGLGERHFVLQYVPGVGFAEENLTPTTKALADILGETAEILGQQVREIAREASGKLRPLVNLRKVRGAGRLRLARDLGVMDFVPSLVADTAAEIVTETLVAVRAIDDPHTDLRPDLELYADLSLDSLQFLEMIVELEGQLGRPIDDEDLLEVDLVTVGDLMAFVETLLVG